MTFNTKTTGIKTMCSTLELRYCEYKAVSHFIFITAIEVKLKTSPQCFTDSMRFTY